AEQVHGPEDQRCLPLKTVWHSSPEDCTWCSGGNPASVTYQQLSTRRRLTGARSYIYIYILAIGRWGKIDIPPRLWGLSRVVLTEHFKELWNATVNIVCTLARRP